MPKTTSKTTFKSRKTKRVRVHNLGRSIHCYRLINDIGVRALAKEIGINASTLCRIEAGESTGGPTLIAILVWMMK